MYSNTTTGKDPHAVGMQMDRLGCKRGARHMTVEVGASWKRIITLTYQVISLLGITISEETEEDTRVSYFAPTDLRMNTLSCSFTQDSRIRQLRLRNGSFLELRDSDMEHPNRQLRFVNISKTRGGRPLYSGKLRLRIVVSENGETWLYTSYVIETDPGPRPQTAPTTQIQHIPQVPTMATPPVSQTLQTPQTTITPPSTQTPWMQTCFNSPTLHPPGANVFVSPWPWNEQSSIQGNFSQYQPQVYQNSLYFAPQNNQVLIYSTLPIPTYTSGSQNEVYCSPPQQIVAIPFIQQQGLQQSLLPLSAAQTTAIPQTAQNTQMAPSTFAVSSSTCTFGPSSLPPSPSETASPLPLYDDAAQGHCSQLDYDIPEAVIDTHPALETNPVSPFQPSLGQQLLVPQNEVHNPPPLFALTPVPPQQTWFQPPTPYNDYYYDDLGYFLSTDEHPGLL
ncbi:hypothetical protein Pelo_7660 [Pelomyxa schiedti]|nr:hypothetical protein Pelo_7660 [Pelomyxa schiedti]